jgi:hypothetical protein
MQRACARGVRYKDMWVAEVREHTAGLSTLWRHMPGPVMRAWRWTDVWDVWGGTSDLVARDALMAYWEVHPPRWGDTWRASRVTWSAPCVAWGSHTRGYDTTTSWWVGMCAMAGPLTLAHAWHTLPDWKSHASLDGNRSHPWLLVLLYAPTVEHWTTFLERVIVRPREAMRLLDTTPMDRFGTHMMWVTMVRGEGWLRATLETVGRVHMNLSGKSPSWSRLSLTRCPQTVQCLARVHDHDTVWKQTTCAWTRWFGMMQATPTMQSWVWRQMREMIGVWSDVTLLEVDAWYEGWKVMETVVLHGLHAHPGFSMTPWHRACIESFRQVAPRVDDVQAWHALWVRDVEAAPEERVSMWMVQWTNWLQWGLMGNSTVAGWVDMWGVVHEHIVTNMKSNDLDDWRNLFVVVWRDAWRYRDVCGAACGVPGFVWLDQFLGAVMRTWRAYAEHTLNTVYACQGLPSPSWTSLWKAPDAVWRVTVNPTVYAWWVDQTEYVEHVLHQLKLDTRTDRREWMRVWASHACLWTRAGTAAAKPYDVLAKGWNGVQRQATHRRVQRRLRLGVSR